MTRLTGYTTLDVYYNVLLFIFGWILKYKILVYDFVSELMPMKPDVESKSFWENEGYNIIQHDFRQTKNIGKVLSSSQQFIGRLNIFITMVWLRFRDLQK